MNEQTKQSIKNQDELFKYLEAHCDSGGIWVSNVKAIANKMDELNKNIAELLRIERFIEDKYKLLVYLNALNLNIVNNPENKQILQNAVVNEIGRMIELEKKKAETKKYL